jgi:hypothetical protein
MKCGPRPNIFCGFSHSKAPILSNPNYYWPAGEPTKPQNHQNLDGKYFICVCTESGVSSQSKWSLFAGFDWKLNVLQGDEKKQSNSVRCEVGSLISLMCNNPRIFFPRGPGQV